MYLKTQTVKKANGKSYTYYRLAESYLLKGLALAREEKSGRFANQVVKQRMTAASHENLALVYREMGQYERALEHATTAIGLNPARTGPLCPALRALRRRVAGLLGRRRLMELTHQLIPQLKHLRLSGILETLEHRQQEAIQHQWSYTDFLQRLLEDEVERRSQKQLALRLRRAARQKAYGDKEREHRK